MKTFFYILSILFYISLIPSTILGQIILSDTDGRVGIGIDPQEKLNVKGKLLLNSEVFKGNRILFSPSDFNNNTGIELVAGSDRSDGYAYIDFSNNKQIDRVDFDARIILAGDDLLTFQGAGKNFTTRILGALNIAGKYTFPKTDGKAGQVLSTDGNGELIWQNMPRTMSDGSDVYNAAAMITVAWLEQSAQPKSQREIDRFLKQTLLTLRSN